MFLEKMDTQLMPKPIWKHVKYGDKGAVWFSQFVACIFVLYFGLNSDITLCQYFLTKRNKYINTCHYRFLTHHSKNDANRHSPRKTLEDVQHMFFAFTFNYGNSLISGRQYVLTYGL